MPVFGLSGLYVSQLRRRSGRDDSSLSTGNRLTKDIGPASVIAHKHTFTMHIPCTILDRTHSYRGLTRDRLNLQARCCVHRDGQVSTGTFTLTDEPCLIKQKETGAAAFYRETNLAEMTLQNFGDGITGYRRICGKKRGDRIDDCEIEREGA